MHGSFGDRPTSCCWAHSLLHAAPYTSRERPRQQHRLLLLTSILNMAKPSVRYMKTLMMRKLASVPNTPYIRMDGSARKKRLFSTDRPQ